MWRFFKTKPKQSTTEKTEAATSNVANREVYTKTRDYFSDYLQKYSPEYQKAIAEDDKVKMKLLEDECLAGEPTAEEMQDLETFIKDSSHRNRREEARKKTILYSVDINRYTPKQYLRLIPHSDYCGDYFHTKSMEKSLEDRGLWSTDEELPTKKLFDDLSQFFLVEIFRDWYKGSYENKTDHWRQFREECFFEFCKESNFHTSSKRLSDRVKKGAEFYHVPKSKYQFDIPGAVFIYSTLQEAPEDKFKLGAIESITRADAENSVRSELEIVGQPIIIHYIEVKKCAHEIVKKLKNQLEPYLSDIKEPLDTSNIQIRVFLDWYHIDLDDLETQLKNVIAEFDSK